MLQTITRPAVGRFAGEERLLEYATVDRASAKVDRAANVIRGVKLLGWESQNGRTYTRQALQKALPLYEGVPVYFDHLKPGAERAYVDRFGETFNVRLTESGLVGDVKYNPNHPRAEQVLFDVENGTSKVGFSPDHYGDGPVRNGKRIVETISKVKSVDIVANPATNRSFSESAGLQESALASAIFGAVSVVRDGQRSFAESITGSPAPGEATHFAEGIRNPDPFSREAQAASAAKRLREAAEEAANPTAGETFARSLRR